MDRTRRRGLLALSWLWIGGVVAYMIWGAFAQAGLYRWLVDLQVARTGGYYDKASVALPILLLSLPALLLIRRHTQAAEAVQEQGPAAEARRMRKVAGWTASIGLLCCLVAFGAYTLAQGVPDGSEEPIAFDVARLGLDPVPDAKVVIRGTVDSDVTSRISETSRYTDRNSLYVAFRADGAAASGAHRLFIERYMGDSDDAAISQGFLPEQDGYLIENGLPPPALADLKARGIAVASPHYVLRPGGDTRRTPYYVTAGVAGLSGVVCLLVALIGRLQAAGRSRRARA